MWIWFPPMTRGHEAEALIAAKNREQRLTDVLDHSRGVFVDYETKPGHLGPPLVTRIEAKRILERGDRRSRHHRRADVPGIVETAFADLLASKETTGTGTALSPCIGLRPLQGGFSFIELALAVRHYRLRAAQQHGVRDDHRSMNVAALAEHFADLVTFGPIQRLG